jgi:hypothetical protein
MPPAARQGTKYRANAQTAKQQKEQPRYMEEPEVKIVIEDIATFNPSTNILIHGPSGHGKTVLASGAPNAYFLTTEVGVVAAKQTGNPSQVIRAPSWEYAVAGVKWAEQNLGLDDWLIVDSGTKMHTLYMRWILATIHMDNPLRDLDIPAPADHQKWQNGFKRWYDRIIDGPFNSIFITTSMTVEDAEGETRVIPHIPGKQGEISDYISAQTSVALYYAVARESKDMRGPIIRRALAQPHPPWFAKDRYSALGHFWDVEEGDFTAMARMIEAINNSARKMEESGGRTTQSRHPTGSRPRRPASRVATEPRGAAASVAPVRNQRRTRGRP